MLNQKIVAVVFSAPMLSARSAVMVARLVALTLFMVYVIGVAPHLVHHVFDHDHAQAECPFAAAGDRQHAATAAVVAITSGYVLIAAVVTPAEPTVLDARDASVD